MYSPSSKAERTARAALALTAASVLIAACGNSGHTPHSRAKPIGELISFGSTTCAPNWRALDAGSEQFRVSNGSASRATVYLFRSDSGVILTTLHNLPAHTSRAVTVSLRPGVGYSWACDLAGHPVHLSDSEPAPRSGTGAAPKVVVPVYVADLVPALDAYRRYVRRTLEGLRGQVGALLAATRSGSLTQSRSDWLTAHITWLRIGQDDGAYGAFGTLGQQIDGTAQGLAGGIDSRSFTGFHRIEDDLWVRHDTAAAARDTAQLQRSVGQLAGQSLGAELPANKAGMTTFTIRTHEVLEDALRDTLSGDDNYGSDTALASLTADVAATREFLALVASDLDPRAPGLEARARLELAALTRAISQASGSLPMQKLPLRERQQIVQSVGAALQTLSNVPDLLAIGGT